MNANANVNENEIDEYHGQCRVTSELLSAISDQNCGIRLFYSLCLPYMIKLLKILHSRLNGALTQKEFKLRMKRNVNYRHESNKFNNNLTLSMENLSGIQLIYCICGDIDESESKFGDDGGDGKSPTDVKSNSRIEVILNTLVSVSNDVLQNCMRRNIHVLELGREAREEKVDDHDDVNKGIMLSHIENSSDVIDVDESDNVDNSDSDKAAHTKTWLSGTMCVLEPHLSTYAFVSFPDWDLSNWQELYFRNNCKKLQQIKAKYDRVYMFRYSQSIVPANWPLDDNNDNYKLKYQRASYQKEQADKLFASSNVGALGDGSTQFLNAKAASVANKHDNSSTSVLIGLVLSIIVIGYDVLYLLLKRNRNDNNDKMETEYNERFLQETAIAV